MMSVVETTAGRVRGAEDDEVRTFRGIPYAAALTEENRFLPPQPVIVWAGERDATLTGATVPQNSYEWPYSELFVDRLIPGAESLNLNVWAPAAGEAAPVLVWIHGGAFAHGSGSVPQYDGTSFARSGVVCVTINYRLGLEGFLDVGDEHSNIGLRDQVAALTWVRDNIDRFGGDPTRVTVAGQSAGAMSIGALLASPAARGLFHGAILQSGAGHHVVSRTSAQAVAQHLAERLGVQRIRDGFASVPVDRANKELAVFEQEMQTAPDYARWGEIAVNMMPMEPVLDGDFVAEPPLDAVSGGSAREVPMLIGTNANENLLFMAPSGVIDLLDEDMVRAAIAGYGFTDVDAILEAYRDPAHPKPGETLAQLATDWMFRIPAVRMAEAQHRGGGHAYMYEFSWCSPARGGSLRASHSMELPFVFDTLDSEGADLLTGPHPPQELASAMHSAWVRFVTDGDPGWAPYTSPERTVRVYGDTVSTLDDPRAEQREAWTGLR